MASLAARVKNEIQKRSAGDVQVKTVRDQLMRMKDQLAMALPEHLTPERMIRIAMTTIQKNPLLLQCDIKSLLGSIIESAQLGLEPDGVLGKAYLIPYKDNKRGRYVAQLIVGYRGLIDLARRSGQIQSICAHVVYENDVFEFEYGLEEKLRHVPVIKDRGKPVGAYAIAKLKDGGHAFEFMSLEEIESIRKRSKAANNGPWVTDWAEMARKTVIRRLAKYLPLSPEFTRAVVLDEMQERGAVLQYDDSIQGVDVALEEGALAIDTAADGAGATIQPPPPEEDVPINTHPTTASTDEPSQGAMFGDPSKVVADAIEVLQSAGDKATLDDIWRSIQQSTEFRGLPDTHKDALTARYDEMSSRMSDATTRKKRGKK